jgi:hypothetical protein
MQITESAIIFARTSIIKIFTNLVGNPVVKEQMGNPTLFRWLDKLMGNQPGNPWDFAFSELFVDGSAVLHRYLLDAFTSGKFEDGGNVDADKALDYVVKALFTLARPLLHNASPSTPVESSSSSQPIQQSTKICFHIDGRDSKAKKKAHDERYSKREAARNQLRRRNSAIKEMAMYLGSSRPISARTCERPFDYHTLTRRYWSTN